MRMWTIHPKYMCRKHLLGEHVEMHMLAGALKRGKSVKGHVERGQLNPHGITERHIVLASEMHRRGYNHFSPLFFNSDGLECVPISDEDGIYELIKRCPDCRAKYQEEIMTLEGQL